MIGLEEKSALIKQYQRKKGDTGSPEVQVAVLTARIKDLTEHLKRAKKDRMAQRGLRQMVGKRRRLLTYLAQKDYAAYQKLLKSLKLRK